MSPQLNIHTVSLKIKFSVTNAKYQSKTQTDS